MLRRTGAISDTSERTIEANILADIVHHVQSNFGRRVTVVSPTQNQEILLGYDATFEGLPGGRAIFLQFKRPYAYRSRKNANFVRFYLDTTQQQTLLRNFGPGEAYYVFVPLPEVREVVANRANLLQIGVALDVHGVPNPGKTSQKSRTVKVTKNPLVPNIQIADPREYEEATKVYTLRNLCENVGSDEPTAGIRGLTQEVRKLELGKRTRDSYLVHVANERRRG
jgi:hypothetical protein